MESPLSTRLDSCFQRLASALRLPPLAPTPNPNLNRNQHHTILLTGSTGFLGCYLLAALLRDESVTRIYCLHRGVDGLARQRESFLDKGIAQIPSNLHTKAQFISMSLYKRNLGLDNTTYDLLLREVTIVIHSAWLVNWVVTLDTFEDGDLLGLNHIIELCLRAHQQPHLYFISSVSSIANWSQHCQNPLREQVVHGAHLPLQVGYAQSKYVAELLLEHAATQAGLRCSIIRPSQISGPTTRQGMWNRNDVIPTLLAASIRLGILGLDAKHVLPMDWIPVDKCAMIIVDIIQTSVNQDIHFSNHSSSSNLMVFHALHPHPSDWSMVVRTVQSMYPVQVIPLDTWIDRLQEPTVSNGQGVSRLDNLIMSLGPLLDCFRGRPSAWGGFDTSQAQESSETLRKLAPINSSLMQNWLQQWMFHPELVTYD